MKRSDHHAVQEVLDGSISQADFDDFQQRIREDPGLARLYGDYALLNHTLCEEFEDRGHPLPPPTASVIRRPPLVWLAAAAALALVAGVLVQHFLKPKPPQRIAVVSNVRFSEDAVWRVENGPHNSLLPGSVLFLLHGGAEFSPSAGGRALLEGPSELLMISPDFLHLAAGRGSFRMEKSGGKLRVSTPSIIAEDAGTAFGISVAPDSPDELHVFEGAVKMRVNGNKTGEMLAAGEAGRVSGADGIERIEADPGRFPRRLAEFRTLVDGPFLKSEWRVDYGTPAIRPDRIDGENFSAFLRFPRPEPDGGNDVLLVTLVTAEPTAGEFHTDGWAGLSLFSGGAELVFFGDSFGPERTWSLDVKQRIPVILPGQPLTGPRTVTLRYDRGTGLTTLHDGAPPLRPAFCTGMLPPGSTFDEIRIGASSSAALAVSALTVRAGGAGR